MARLRGRSLSPRAVLTAVVFTLLVLLPALPAQAIRIERVVSPGGIEAWLVQDHKVPVLAIEFAFKGGAALDPKGKTGLANLLSSLLDEGAGDLDSQEFQRRLQDSAISIGFGAERDGFLGSLRTLVENQDEAVDLLRLALTRPRFDADAIERIRNSIMAGIRSNQGDPDWVARRTFFDAAFPDHPYGTPVEGTLDSLPRLDAEDLRAFVRQRFARDVLQVGVTGDITPERLGPLLDRLFGDLPARAEPFEVVETAPQGAGDTLLVPRPTQQSVILFGQQGVKRADPDWFPAVVMNYVLGGGGFGSRLMEEVRVKRGLSYGVYSHLAPFDHAALIMAGGNTVNDKAGEALDIMRQVWNRVREQGITEEELADAKTYLTGSYPLQFTSTSAIARVVLQVQRDNLGIDYLDRREGLINAVTLDDVQRVARRLLDPARLTTVVVGQPQGVQATRVLNGNGEKS